MALIQIVDDDVDVAKTIEINLTQNGYQVQVAHNGHEALASVNRQTPDLVLLDMAMPEMDGVEVCRRLRANVATAGIPILFLTVSKDIKSKTDGFNAGADDYLVKPFDLQELNLRVKALLRRGAAKTSGEASAEITVGSLVLNCQTFELRVKGKKILLTPVEFELVRHMMLHVGQVLSAENLLRQVWKYPDGTGSPELVRAHIKNLRNKVEPNPQEPIYIKTVGRFGYTISNDNPG
ncbi:MAG: response regulator transcription factor [Chloroflexi bacterium]|nr:response regulator transcription factor [Chloroflexota bacterium]